jgi:hypothetical protein
VGQAWQFLGQPVSPESLDLIKAIVGECAGLSRDELVATVCDLLGWTRATGRVKTRECRDLLARVASAGLITLPAKRVGRPVGARTAVPVTARGDVQAAVTGTVRDVTPLEIVRVTTPEDRLLFRELIESGEHDPGAAGAPDRGGLAGDLRDPAGAAGNAYRSGALRGGELPGGQLDRGRDDDRPRAQRPRRRAAAARPEARARVSARHRRPPGGRKKKRGPGAWRERNS